MANFFGDLATGLKGLGSDIFALAPLVGVVLAIVIINRILNRQAGRTSGLRFRNQLIIAAVTFVGTLVIVIVLPVDAGVRGQLLTVIGLIISVTISLSSSTFLGNAMAGVMLKTVRNFRSGDFVHVGEHFGRVTERGLFHTEIQTPTRDLTTLPNLFLATTPVTVVRSSGTIVDATVSLGYDVPRGVVEELLLAAAAQAELKEPFVQVLELGDFSVNYRIAGLLEDTKRLLTFRSRLRANMLDSLHGGGVEIVSPNFMNVRDFANRHEFRPTAETPAAAAPAEAPLDVVFDKAEEAESISALHKKREEVEARCAELAQEIKAATDAESKAGLEARLAKEDERRLRLTEEITAAEAREKAND